MLSRLEVAIRAIRHIPIHVLYNCYFLDLSDILFPPFLLQISKSELRSISFLSFKSYFPKYQVTQINTNH